MEKTLFQPGDFILIGKERRKIRTVGPLYIYLDNGRRLRIKEAEAYPCSHVEGRSEQGDGLKQGQLF